MKTLSLLILIFLTPVLSAKTLNGVVLSIHDGDTLTFVPEGSVKKAKLRLLGVDTPEIDFNGSSQGEVAFMARDYLMSMLPLNAKIQIELSDKNTDSNGRYLGQIKYQGRDLNLEILKAGWGATYFIYPYDKKVVVEYQKASQYAFENNLGIFSNKYKTQPLGYMFRQGTKGVAGTNLVADFVTKRIYSAEDVELVPHFHRVFFSSEETAIIHGFNW
jgi:micrococcal nuclease